MGKIAFLGIGTNLGDREGFLNKAIENIGNLAGRVITLSKIYETESWGFRTENKFLNMVIGIETKLSPGTLLKRLLQIETLMGRERSSEGYASRTIDLDILLYDELVIRKPDLRIPHPLIQDRKFVLVPLCDIVPEMIHPVLKKTFAMLLKECDDTGIVTAYMA